MKAAGDLSDQYKELAPELIKFERSIDTEDCYPKEGKAMMYTCLAHDWYSIDMEEEGARLLLKADKACPGYFNGPVVQHQIENPSFDALMGRLTRELVNLFADTLRNK